MELLTEIIFWPKQKKRGGVFIMLSTELTSASYKTDASKHIQTLAVPILSEVPCPDQGHTVLVPDWIREAWQPTNQSSWNRRSLRQEGLQEKNENHQTRIWHYDEHKAGVQKETNIKKQTKLLLPTCSKSNTFTTCIKRMRDTAWKEQRCTMHLYSLVLLENCC